MAIVRLDTHRETPGGPGISLRGIDLAVRLIAAVALMVASLDLITVSVPDRRVGSTIYWQDYHLWWLTIPAVVGAAFLVLPEATARRSSMRLPAVSMAPVLMIGGFAAITIVAPTLAWREATLYDHPSAFDIGLALSVPASYGVISMMAAALIACRVASARWGPPVIGGLAALGFFACIGPVFVTQFVVSWTDWTSPQTAGSLRAVIESGAWALAAVMAGLIIGAPGAVLGSGIGRALARAAIIVAVGGGLVLGLGGWIAAAACVAGDGAVGEYACAYAVPLIVASAIVTVGGLTVTRCVASREKEP